MEMEVIVTIVVSLCILIVALVIFFSKPKKEVERQQIGFLKTNIQLLKIKNNKTSEEIKKKKGTLLVVDDSVVISNFINKLFNNEYEIIIAKDGTQAITTINKNENITGMLLDLNMPNVNGFEVLEFMSLRGLFDKIPTAVITGIGRDEAIEQVKLYPIVDVLRKPFNEKDVKEVIEKIVTK